MFTSILTWNTIHKNNLCNNDVLNYNHVSDTKNLTRSLKSHQLTSKIEKYYKRYLIERIGAGFADLEALFSPNQKTEIVRIFPFKNLIIEPTSIFWDKSFFVRLWIWVEESIRGGFVKIL